MDAAHQSTPANALDQRTRVLLEAPMPPTLLKLATLLRQAGPFASALDFIAPLARPGRR
jgi:hypothetical protein